MSTKDPLLTAAHVLTIAVRIGLVMAMIALGVFGALTVIGWETGEGVTTAAKLAVIALSLTSLGLLYDFATRLAQIIGTVKTGDPFILPNAGRLTRMGWLILIVLVLEYLSELIDGWLEAGQENLALQIGVTELLTGLGLALVLFILARVFRKGAEMREDLEGTV